jgi:uncharacterized membrane protein YccC
MTIKASPILPEFLDVVFSIKTFIAAVLALLVMFAFDLENPYWAVGTVYIVSHPLSGASTSKAIYRLLGTVLGGTMTIILVPNLVNSPLLLTLGISLWMAVCLVISMLDRSPRSYVFMLGGYTTALTGFPLVDSPDTSFTYATGRVIGIAVGIICAALVSRLVFPRHAGPVLSKRIDAWLASGTTLALNALEGRQDAANAGMVRRLAAESVELRGFTTHVAYDTSAQKDAVGLARILQRRMVALLPITSGLADVLGRLAQATESSPIPAIKTLSEQTAAWLRSGEALTEEKRQEFLDVIALAESQSDQLPQWDRLLVENVIARMRDLIQICSDCIDLKLDILTGSRHSLRWRRFGETLDARPMHRDIGMALRSGFSAILSTCIACAFWILSGWPQGTSAAMMAGVVCCLFSTMDDPVPAIRGFLVASIFAVVAAFVLDFAILPVVTTFVPFAAALGLFLLPFGILMARPQTMLLGLGFCVNMPNMLSIQNRLSLDLTTFLNSNIALVIGLAIACGTTALVRSVDAEWSAYRLLRAGWADIAAVARNQRISDITVLLHQMVDRLGLIAPRLGAIPEGSHVLQSDMLKDLRNGLNTIGLQRDKQLLTSDNRAAVDDVLVLIARHYQSKGRNAPGESKAVLLATLDRSLATLGNAGDNPPARDASRALAGIRYNLFPDAPALAANENIAVTREDLKEKAA